MRNIDWLVVLLAYIVFSNAVSMHMVSSKLRRIWLQDHCHATICAGIVVAADDYVIMSQAPIPKQITLTFVNSSIAKIPHLMFDTFPDLQLLRMENCSVELFEKPQFEGASNLIGIFLGYNRIRDIPKNIFLGADNLNTLHLEANRLRKLNDGSFNALKELKELSLANNQLTILYANAFNALRKLVVLDLSGNRLNNLPSGIFDQNQDLSSINLSRNLFKAFQTAVLQKQTHISLLDLSGNILHEVSFDLAFLGTVVANDCDLRRVLSTGIVRELELRNNSLMEFPHLLNAANTTSLDLSHNPMGALRDSVLRPYTGLQRLNLSATKIPDLPEGIFKNQQDLKSLDISGNSIYSLKIGIFESLKQLQYFYFHQNNWNCDFLQLLMNSFVKRRNIVFFEDFVAPELVDDYIDGIACWYENDRSSKKCTSPEAALELSIVRNEIKAFTEIVDKKFFKVFRLLEEMKTRL